jgi:hypothetical protein
MKIKRENKIWDQLTRAKEYLNRMKRLKTNELNFTTRERVKR